MPAMDALVSISTASGAAESADEEACGGESCVFAYILVAFVFIPIVCIPIPLPFTQSGTGEAPHAGCVCTGESAAEDMAGASVSESDDEVEHAPFSAAAAAAAASAGERVTQLLLLWRGLEL